MGGLLHHSFSPQSPMAPLCPLPLTRNWPDSMYLVQIQCILSRFNESVVWSLHATLLELKGVVREPRAIAFVLWEPLCIPKLYLSSPHVPFDTHSAQGVRLCWNLSRFLARVIMWEGSRPLTALIGLLLGQLSSGLVNKFHINTSSFRGGVGLINAALNTMSLIFKCVCALSVIHDSKWAFKFRLNAGFIANLVSLVSEHKVLSFLVKESDPQHNRQGLFSHKSA